MSDGSRIPGAIPLFNNYITQTNNRLQATNPDTGNPYYEDYNISKANADSWATQDTEWVKTVYAAYSDAATSTSIAKSNVRSFMKEFREFALPLLNLIAASPVSGNEEEHIFDLVLHRKDPVRHDVPVAKQCIASIHPLGSGVYEIGCRGNNDEGRSKKVENADSVQYAFVIAPQQPNPLPPPGDSSLSKDLSTTALFTHDFGGSNLGKWLVIYFRWYNTKHPNLAGPWSEAQVLPVS